MKWRFFPKKHVKFGRIKRDLFKVCSIASYIFFPSFGQFVDTTPVKIFSFCESFIEPFFHIFVRKRCSASAWPIDANKWCAWVYPRFFAFEILKKNPLFIPSTIRCKNDFLLYRSSKISMFLRLSICLSFNSCGTHLPTFWIFPIS